MSWDIDPSVNWVSDNESGSQNGQSSAVAKPESPTETYARLNREQFADQQARYLPFENMATDMLLDSETRNQYRQEGLDITDNAVNTAFDRSDAQIAMVRSRTNQGQSSRRKSSSDRLSALDRASVGVSSRNSTRDFMDEREMELIGG